jgi:hypothetical protein
MPAALPINESDLCIAVAYCDVGCGLEREAIAIPAMGLPVQATRVALR